MVKWWGPVILISSHLKQIKPWLSVPLSLPWRIFNGWCFLTIVIYSYKQLCINNTPISFKFSDSDKTSEELILIMCILSVPISIVLALETGKNILLRDTAAAWSLLYQSVPFPGSPRYIFIDQPNREDEQLDGVCMCVERIKPRSADLLQGVLTTASLKYLVQIWGKILPVQYSIPCTGKTFASKWRYSTYPHMKG